ncbi:maltose acetyltransferase domain-containing protein [Lacrimispora sp.]|uniref:maltose acetyltransferase domain-containing protein n=1 Tax=Lacrimispora sp. TaxID=2719234 RepID=UPI002FD97ED5
MQYEESEFLETASKDILDTISRARELTRTYYFTDYQDSEKRNTILRELLGGMGENIAIDAPFHCDYGYQRL